VIGQLQPQQLMELLSHLKGMAQTNVQDTRNVLMANPQLAYAAFQTLLQMNMVDQYTMQRLSQQQPPQDAVQEQQKLALQEQQKMLLMQLMNLTPDQIHALPLEQQQQIMQLKAQVLSQK
jgi:cleavage stimulation factor subunit 2